MSHEDRFKQIQRDLKDKVSRKNSFEIESIKTIAGIDLAYWQDENVEKAVCCVVIVDFHTGKVLERKQCFGTIDVPYIPGYLAFRELPLVLDTINTLEIKPDMYMFDGNGYLHARHMGIATHASFYLDKPTIGVAKSYLKIGDTDFTMPKDVEGAYEDIIIDSDVYGRVYRSHKNVNPIFISVGNYIDLDTATYFVKNMITSESRIPIPTRLADIETHKYRKMARVWCKNVK